MARRVSCLVDLKHASGHLHALSASFRRQTMEHESNKVEEFVAWLWTYREVFEADYRDSRHPHPLDDG